MLRETAGSRSDLTNPFHWPVQVGDLKHGANQVRCSAGLGVDLIDVIADGRPEWRAAASVLRAGRKDLIAGSGERPETSCTPSGRKPRLILCASICRMDNWASTIFYGKEQADWAEILQ